MIKRLFIAYAVFFSSLSMAEELPDVIGEVYSLDGKQALYTEQHYYSDDGERHRVVYLSLDGQAFAHKEVDYRSGKLTPVFRQEDTRTSEVIEVKWEGEQLSISYLSDDNSAQQQKVIKAKSPLVIDAGFDNFIRENWALLSRGEKLQFHFPAPTRLRLVNLIVEGKQCSYVATSQRCFSINAANWLVKLLVDPIELGYDNTNQQLMRFRGLANINDENGKGIKVDIRYHYPKAADCSDNTSACMEVSGYGSPTPAERRMTSPRPKVNGGTVANASQHSPCYLW